MKQLSQAAARWLSQYLAPLTLFVGLPCCASAQLERYELGQRVRACELEWDAHRAPEDHRRAVPKMQSAVMGFFAGQFGEVGKSLDNARYALRSVSAPSSDEVWANSLSFVPEKRLLDADETSLNVRVTSFYKVAGDIPKNATVKIQLTVRHSEPSITRSLVSVVIDKLPKTAELKFSKQPEGDYLLTFTVMVNGHAFAKREMTLSFARNLRGRLSGIQSYIAANPKRTAGATAANLCGLLSALANGETFETDYPAAHLLAQARTAANAELAGQECFGNRVPGEYWLTLVNGDHKAHTRVLAPAAVTSGSPLPLVIALHGAGGSENMFFDSYGHGATVELCRKRGWLLLAPRAEAGTGAATIAEIIDSLSALYPVDRKHVFLVGHSMGAMQGVGHINRKPELFAGAALISGGGSLTADTKHLPIFVGVGAEDFAITMSRQLQTGLKKLETETTEYHEYPDCEHLFAVQDALPDIFAFFDKIAHSTGR